MKYQITILALATAGLLAATTTLRAEDPVPPTPPVDPPAAKADGGARRERGPGGGERGDRLEMMKEQLGLTPEQVEKLKPIFAKDAEQYKALREDAALSREQKGEKMRAIFQASREQIQAILTPGQVEKMKAAMEKRRAEWEKRKADQDKPETK